MYIENQDCEMYDEEVPTVKILTNQIPSSKTQIYITTFVDAVVLGRPVFVEFYRAEQRLLWGSRHDWCRSYGHHYKGLVGGVRGVHTNTYD
jgi:hypothetical protein